MIYFWVIRIFCCVLCIYNQGNIFPFTFNFNRIFLSLNFSKILFGFEPNEISFVSKSKGKLSPRSLFLSI